MEEEIPDGFEDSICNKDCEVMKDWPTDDRLHYHNPFKILYLYCVSCAKNYKKDAPLIFKKCTIMGLFHGQFAIDTWECPSCNYQLDSSCCVKLYKFTGEK